jgi:hypothetical protein
MLSRVTECGGDLETSRATDERRDVRGKKLVALDQTRFRPLGELSKLAAGRREQRACGAGALFLGAPDRSMAQPGSDT